MPASFEAINILLFLIPGFISSAIFSALVVRRRDKGELGKIVEALIFSMFVYLVYSPFGRKPISMAADGSLDYDALSFLILIVPSLVFPLALSWLVTNDWHMQVARRKGITNRTARSSTWYDVFSDEERFILIRFKDGRKLFGWAEHYSDDPDEPYIYVTSPHKVGPDGRLIEHASYEGVLITPQMEIEYIWFLKDDADQAVKEAENA
jgi:hypothetical protein